MKYTKTRIDEYTREASAQIYMTDAFMLISENTSKTAQASGSSGRYMSKRFYDVLNNTNKSEKKEDTRNGEEIANDVIKRITRKG